MRNIGLQIKRGNSPLVVLPLEEWQRIEDVISELSAPKLLKSIDRARKDYKNGKAVSFKTTRK